jgi:hypothetical protein
VNISDFGACKMVALLLKPNKDAVVIGVMLFDIEVLDMLFALKPVLVTVV